VARASELVAEIVPRVATASREAATLPAQGAPGILTRLRGEQEPSPGADGETQHDASDDERGLAAAVG